MTRLTVCVGVACAALVGVVAGVATSGAQAPGPPTGALEVVLRERDASFRFVDNPPRRKESAGDMAIISGRLRAADGSARGRLQAYFVATKGGDFERAFRGQVTGTLMLSDGDIVLEGVTDDRRDQEPLAIVGGTGAYAGARGTAVVTDTPSLTRFQLTFMP
jgi:hypothetical protein